MDPGQKPNQSLGELSAVAALLCPPDRQAGFLILGTSGKEGQAAWARACSLTEIAEIAQTGGKLFIM